MRESLLLNYKFLCLDHFLSTDFMTSEGIRLYRFEVTRGLDSASHAIPQHF
jgi:hypothetical protein